MNPHEQAIRLISLAPSKRAPWCCGLVQPALALTKAPPRRTHVCSASMHRRPLRRPEGHCRHPSETDGPPLDQPSGVVHIRGAPTRPWRRFGATNQSLVGPVPPLVVRGRRARCRKSSWLLFEMTNGKCALSPTVFTRVPSPLRVIITQKAATSSIFLLRPVFCLSPRPGGATASVWLVSSAPVPRETIGRSFDLMAGGDARHPRRS